MADKRELKYQIERKILRKGFYPTASAKIAESKPLLKFYCDCGCVFEAFVTPFELKSVCVRTWESKDVNRGTTVIDTDFNLDCPECNAECMAIWTFDVKIIEPENKG